MDTLNSKQYNNNSKQVNNRRISKMADYNANVWLSNGNKATSNAVASEQTEQKNRFPFIKNDVRFTKVNGGMVGDLIRILPAYDLSKYGSDEFATSTMPYRMFFNLSDGVEVDDGVKEEFTKWFFAVPFYEEFTPGRKCFASPLAGRWNGPELDDKYPMNRKCGGLDPIMDLRSHIVFDKKESRKSVLRIARDKNFVAKLPYRPRTMILANAIVYPRMREDGTQPEPYQCVLGFSSYKTLPDLLDQLNWPRAYKQTVVCDDRPGYDRYMFGDPTDVKRGRLFKVIKEESADTKYPSYMLRLSDEKQSTKGIIKDVPEITIEQLKNRRFIGDILDIPTYQDILNTLIEGRYVPRDVLVGMCNRYHIAANIPVYDWDPKMLENMYNQDEQDRQEEEARRRGEVEEGGNKFEAKPKPKSDGFEAVKRRDVEVAPQQVSEQKFEEGVGDPNFDDSLSDASTDFLDDDDLDGAEEVKPAAGNGKNRMMELMTKMQRGEVLSAEEQSELMNLAKGA